MPVEYRVSFRHLYFVAWFGLLSASAMSFVAVYAARQGASVFQIGLIGVPIALGLFAALRFLVALVILRWG